MRRLLNLLMCCCISLTTFAQVYSGKIVDEKSQPLPYANVVLLSLPDSAFVTGTVSDESGAFTLKTNQDNLLLRVSSIGYATLYNKVEKPDLGMIQLLPDAQLLGEVVVKGDLPVTRIKGDALVTNVQNSVLSKAGTANDVLARIPGIDNSNEGLKVFGRGVPEIYLNGRKVRDDSELDQLSSDNIKSVEVVRNPGARYAASVKAVVRIVTKKATGDGWSANERAMARYNKKWGFLNQLNLNYRWEGLDVFGMVYYQNRHDWAGHDSQERAYLDQVWTQNIRERETGKMRQVSVNAGANYVFNENHTAGFRYQYNRVPQNQLDFFYNVDVFRDGKQDEQTSTAGYREDLSDQHAVNLYYTGKAGGWSIDFNADLLWKTGDTDEKDNEEATGSGGTVDRRTVTSLTDTDARLYAGKLVLSYPLGEGLLSLGGEYSYMHRTSLFRNAEGILAADNNKINEGMAAAFAEYARRFGKLDIRAGVRYESVNFNYYQENVLQEEQSKVYHNVFPSLALSMPVGNVELQLSYKADIERPTYRQLRSNVSYANRYSYETGNPLLSPALTHNVELLASWHWLHFNVGYRRVKDGIVYTERAYSEEEPYISLLTMKNASAYDCLSGSVVLSPTWGIWSPQLTLGVEKQWYDAESPQGVLALHRPVYNIRWNNSLKLPLGLLLTADAGWNSEGDYQNMRIRESWYMDMSLYKDFLRGQLSLLLKGSDLFLSRRYGQMSYFGLRTYRQHMIPNTRNVALTVRYKFNATKSKYKGTGAGQEQRSRM